MFFIYVPLALVMLLIGQAAAFTCIERGGSRGGDDAPASDRAGSLGDARGFGDTKPTHLGSVLDES